MKMSEPHLIAALKKHGGLMSLAAQELGVSRQAVWERVQKSKALQDAIKEAEETLLDIGEGHIVRGVKSGDKSYVTYYMDRKGRGRGYGNKVETTVDDEQLKAFVAALGGDPEKLRAARAAIAAEDPEG